jgi:hypothetical protein
MIAALLCAGTMMIGACSSNGSTSASAVSAGTGSPAGQAKVNCAAVDSLRGSLQRIAHTTVGPSSQASLTADVTNVQKQTAVLKRQGGKKFSGVTSELTVFVDHMKKASSELATNPAAALQQATAAVSRLKGKLKPLIAKLDKACPKPAT